MYHWSVYGNFNKTTSERLFELPVFFDVNYSVINMYDDDYNII